MSALRDLPHLARRFLGSLSRRPPAAAEVAWAHDHLLPAERELWDQTVAADQRHTVLVARRFVEIRPGATRAEIAGALLHDIGKVDLHIGTVERIVATIAGPRTARWRRYHDHEAIGAELLADLGSDPVTVALARGDGPAATDLRAADHV